MDFLYEGTPLIAFALDVALLVLVLRHNWRNRLHQVFGFFLFNMGLWSLAVYTMRRSFAPEQALLWEKVSFGLLLLVAASFYHFIFVSTRRKGALWQLVLPYASVPLLAVLLSGDWLISGITLMWYGYGFVAGPLLPVYLVTYYAIVLTIVFLLLAAYRKAESVSDKRRYVFMTAGAMMGLLGVASDYLAANGLRIYPTSVLTSILFASLCTYALPRSEQFDIALATRKGTAYVLAYAFGTTVYVGLVFAVYTFVTRTEVVLDWFHIAFLLLATIGLQPALRYSQRLVDRWFYRDRYDYLVALERLSDRTRDITELSFIASLLLDTIIAAMRCRNALVLLPDADGSNFIEIVRRGTSHNGPLRLHRDGALIKWLGERSEPVSRDDVQSLPQLQAMTTEEKEMLGNLDVELFVPLTTREGLRGILALGPSLSGDRYAPSDIRLLRIAARQMSNIIDNARLYDLLRRRYEEQALLARLTGIVSSELELTSMCDQLLTELAKAVPIDYATIILVDPEKKVPVNAYSWGGGTDPMRERDVSAVTGTAPERQTEAGEFKSVVRLPLECKDKVIGDFVLASREPGVYGEDGLRVLHQVAVQLAVGIDRAQLYHVEKATREELERQYNERTDFINALIHEVKTPMTAIIASSELLREELAGSDTLGPLADNLDIAAHGLDHRITELVDFVKLQRTETSLNTRLVDLRPLAERAAAQIAGVFRQRDQKLVLEFPPRLGRVRADPERLTQVLFNLLTNASKFSGKDTTITLRGYAAANNLVIEVQDSAPPIKSEETALLFQRYYRAGQRGSGGLGLGLFICKRLVELHGGKIWIETDGNGNRFKFALPLAARREVKHESPAH
ncbi:MAG: GAF domain-containing protein [Chloroflexi bacterium]|nr:GAF domain-containing protein [Chloroflexota bacterium]